jgi:pimeloyl-ACP methyl ester carboxylesterase
MRYIVISLIFLTGCLVNTPSPSTPFSHWQKSAKAPNRGIVVLIHGLNNKPEVMDALAAEMNRRGFDTLRIALSGHRPDKSTASKEKWIAETSEVLKGLAREYSDKPLYIIGFSVGATAFIATLEQNPDIPVKKAVFLAPAIKLRSYSNLMRPLLPLSYIGCPIVTVMPKEYSAFTFPPLLFYRVLFELVDQLQAPKRAKTLQTLLFLTKGDEFISYDKTLSWVESNKLPWQTIEILPQATLKGSFAHLIIDEPSLGRLEWQRMTDLIDKFLM